VKKIFIIPILCLFTAVQSGCITPHYVTKDFPGFLNTEAGKASLGKCNTQTSYQLSDETVKHSYSIRSFISGYANEWTVKFGELLDQYINSSDVQKAFGTLSKVTSGPGSEEKLFFNLIDYKFTGGRAYIKMSVSHFVNGHPVKTWVYEANGEGQFVKMLTVGSFAMTRLVEKSTKTALDDIFTRLIADLNAPSATTQ
jgi:hypothetical protein